MDEDFFSRLDKYMKYKKLNDNKLTKIASLSVGALGKQRKGGRGLSIGSIANILYSCTDLSADWLLTGRGDMIVRADCENISGNDDKLWKIINSQIRQLDSQSRQLESQQRQLEIQAHSIENLSQRVPAVALDGVAKMAAGG